MKRVKKLWQVTAKNNVYGRLPEGDLLVLAPNAAKATEKAVKWLKRHAYFSYKITSVDYQGEIDIF